MSKLVEGVNLKQKEIKKLLKLEELFHSHYLTEDLLNEMISLYVRFSENIQQGKNHVRLYFMEKIRFVLSRPEVIKSLDKLELDQEKTKTDQLENSNQINNVQLKRLEDQAKAEALKNQVGNPNRKKAFQSAQLMQKQKNMKIEMQLKIMKQVQDNMNTFREDLNNQNKKRSQKQIQINKLVSKQDETLNQRRANRKKKRKRSSDLTEKQITSVDIPPYIPLQELKNVHKEINQTYQRFTRLTQNKLQANSNKKENEGRVKYQIEQRSYEQQQDFFDSKHLKTNGQHKKIEKQQIKQQSQKIDQQKKTPQQQQKEVQIAPSRQTTKVEYGAFDQKNGRVTERNNQYEQIDEEEYF